MGVESNAQQNLENLSKSILEFSSEIQVDTIFTSFQAALEYLFLVSQKERLLLVIDEYPYVARSSKSLASTLQLLIDKYKDTSRLMLILCGSSMSYIEDHVLAYKAPLYGRWTAQMKILPFDFSETCQYFPEFSEEDKALVYGIAGGTPQYLLQLFKKPYGSLPYTKRTPLRRKIFPKIHLSDRRQYVSLLVSFCTGEQFYHRPGSSRSCIQAHSPSPFPLYRSCIRRHL